MRGTIAILLVEYDHVDAAATIRALKELDIDGTLIHAKNGREALAYLQDENAARPALVIADIHMPKMNGLEFLHEVKSNPTLQQLPVIVLSSSENPADKNLSLSYGAVGYIVKPVRYEQLLEALRKFKDYWCLSGLACSPQQPESAGV
jgi:CheY-like chemotaxis protein